MSENINNSNINIACICGRVYKYEIIVPTKMNKQNYKKNMSII